MLSEGTVRSDSRVRRCRSKVVFEDAVRMLMFDLTPVFEGWCSEEMSCLKRTVSVWLSVMTDAEPLGDVAFIADGPPDERLPLLHSP